jgi:hypothetical protein
MSLSRKEKLTFLSPLQAMCKNRSFLKNYNRQQQGQEPTLQEVQTLNNDKKSSAKNIDTAGKSVAKEGGPPMPHHSRSIDKSPDLLQKTQDANFYKYKQSFGARVRHTKKTSIDSEYSLKIDFNGLFNCHKGDNSSKFVKKADPVSGQIPKESKFYHSINKSSRNLSSQVSFFHNNSKTNNKLSYIEDAALMGKFFPPKLEIKNFKLKDWKNGKPKPDEISKNCPVINSKADQPDQMRPSNSRKQLNVSSYNKRNTTFSVSKEPMREMTSHIDAVTVCLVEKK